MKTLLLREFYKISLNELSYGQAFFPSGVFHHCTGLVELKVAFGEVAFGPSLMVSLLPIILIK